MIPFSGIIPCLVHLVGLFLIPESPRWLVSPIQASAGSRILGWIVHGALIEWEKIMVVHIYEAYNKWKSNLAIFITMLWVWLPAGQMQTCRRVWSCAAIPQGRKCWYFSRSSWYQSNSYFIKLSEGATNILILNYYY